MFGDATFWILSLYSQKMKPANIKSVAIQKSFGSKLELQKNGVFLLGALAYTEVTAT